MSATMRKDVPLTPQTIIGDDELQEQEYQSFVELDQLLNLGIAKNEIKKLTDHGIHTVDAIIMTQRRKLADIKGLSDAKVEKLMEAAMKLCPHRVAFRTAGDVLAFRQQHIVRLTTGSAELDKILGGGVETNSLTEIHGEYRTGKTQLVTTLCVTSLLPEDQGGGSGRVLVLDSENTFRPERIRQIAVRFGYPENMALDNIHVARVYTPDQFENRLADAAALLVKEEYRLIVIDSIMMPFRFDYSGRGELSERQQRLGQIVHKFKKFAEEFNVAIVMTNQVCADPGSMFSNDAKKAVGGHILAHLVDTRLSVRKGRGENRVAKIVDSPLMPEQDANFMISEGGIIDSTD